MTAINFPDSPSNGDTHVVGGVTYTYDSTETKWKTTINSNAFLPLTGGTVSGNIVLGGELQHSGDTDTKLHFDTDTIKFDTAGSERFRVDSSGRLGLGTSSPDQTLSVGSGAADTRMSINGTGQYQLKFTNSGAAGFWIGSPGANSLAFAQDGGTTRMTIDSSGNLKFNSGYGSAATAYGCRAWVNFNGTGAVAIRASGNVSSITDNGLGSYTVNFTTAMPDANYSAIVTTNANAGWNTATRDLATSSVGIGSFNGNGNTEDSSTVSAAIFR